MKRMIQLDALRGYALLCIMLDHMPKSVLREGTLANFSVFDAAELFVLLSGYLVGMVWLITETREGRRAAQWRFARRAFQVWRALVVGAVVMALLSAALLAAGWPHTAIWNRYAAWIIENPLGYIGTVAFMWMQPNLLDVLALYVLLIASVPVLVPLLQRWPWAFAAASLGLWWVAPVINAMIPNQNPRGLLFDPFGWQMLFFSGVAMGLFRDRIMAALLPHARLVTVVAAAMFLFGASIIIALKFGEAALPVRNALKLVYGSIDKWHLDGTRYLAIMAATWLVVVPLARPVRWVAATGAGRAMQTIGRGGLWSFVACVLLSVLADAFQMTPAGQGTARRLAVDLWAMLALWVAAYGWLNRRTLWRRGG